MVNSSDKSDRVTVLTSDKKKVALTNAVLLSTQFFKDLRSEPKENAILELTEVTERALKKIVEYCELHGEDAILPASSSALSTDNLKGLNSWEKKFIPTQIDHLLEILKGAEKIGVEALFDLICEVLAIWMKDRDLEDIRLKLRISSDFTEEELPERLADKEWVQRFQPI